MLTYNTNSKTGPVCGGRATLPTISPAFVGLFYLSANHRGTLTGVGAITKGLHSF